VLKRHTLLIHKIKLPREVREKKPRFPGSAAAADSFPGGDDSAAAAGTFARGDGNAAAAGSFPGGDGNAAATNSFHVDGVVKRPRAAGNAAAKPRGNLKDEYIGISDDDIAEDKQRTQEVWSRFCKSFSTVIY
jgi:hypothetical protein